MFDKILEYVLIIYFSIGMVIGLFELYTRHKRDHRITRETRRIAFKSIFVGPIEFVGMFLGMFTP